MNKEKILEDINIILEGNLQRLMVSQGRRKVIPYPDKSVELLHKLSQKLIKAECDYFWEIIVKPFKEEVMPVFLPLNISKEQKAILNIHGNFGRVFEFLIKANKIDVILKFFEKERNIDHKVMAVLYKIRELLNAKYSGFNREILVRVEEYVTLLINQISRELRYEDVLAKYEGDIAEKARIVAIDGVKLDTPIKPTKPTEPRKYYQGANQEDINDCAELLGDISARVKLFKLDILEKEYEGINLEINQDQESLKTTIKEFGFNIILNNSLDKINRQLNEAKDEFDFKASIDLIRTFLHELCVSIGLKIEKATEIQHSGPIKKMGNALAYLRDSRIKFLIESEFEFLVKFNGFISDKGVHSLKSEKEYARIARNFVVEFGLFLVKRLEKYLNDLNKTQPNLTGFVRLDKR